MHVDVFQSIDDYLQNNIILFTCRVCHDTGAFCFMLVLILDMQPLCLKDQAKFIDNMMIYFPHYALGSGLKNIYSSYEYSEICDFQKNGKSLASSNRGS